MSEASMDADQVLEEFTEEEHTGEAVILYVRQIRWEGPDTPVSIRTEVARLDPDASRQELEETRRRLLRDRRYFGLCKSCGEWNPRGWMHGRSVCQSCAQSELGVVY